MIEQVRRASGIIFYIMGCLFFLLYLLHVNSLGGLWPRWIMEVFDQSLILIALMYAGSSFFLSITDPQHPSKIAVFGITIPLVIVFVLLLIMNYWNLLFG